MQKKFKMLLVLCCVMALLLTGIGVPVARAATVDSLTVSNMFSSLGEATQYGIVAHEWDQNAHAETNACVDLMDRHVNTVFSNTGSTYFHALGYRLEADVTAPVNPGLNGMTFALFKESEDGEGFVLIDGSQITINADLSQVTLSWDIDGMGKTALKDLKNTRLYVRQVNADGSYVDEGATNEANLVVNYGPSISASAYNTNYIGKLFYANRMNEGDSIGIFNTSGNTPGIEFGADTRLYHKVGDEYVEIDLNDTSLVIRVQYRDAGVYLAGDCSATGETVLLQRELPQPVTVYKVSHHGSSDASSAALLAALSPRYCAISCAAQNEYGHPHRATLDRLEALGIPVYRTDTMGTLAFVYENGLLRPVTDY